MSPVADGLRCIYDLALHMWWSDDLGSWTSEAAKATVYNADDNRSLHLSSSEHWAEVPSCRA